MSPRIVVGLLLVLNGCASTVRYGVTPWLRVAWTTDATLLAESGTHHPAVLERREAGRWARVEGAQTVGLVVPDGRGVLIDWNAPGRGSTVDPAHEVHEHHLLAESGPTVVFRSAGVLRLSPENELLAVDLIGSEPASPQVWIARIVRFSWDGHEADRREVPLPTQPEEAGRSVHPRFIGFLAERLVFVVEFAHERDGGVNRNSLRDPCVAYALDPGGGWHVLGEQPPGAEAHDRCVDVATWRRVLGVPIIPGLAPRPLDEPPR